MADIPPLAGDMSSGHVPVQPSVNGLSEERGRCACDPFEFDLRDSAGAEAQQQGREDNQELVAAVRAVDMGSPNPSFG
jgi:hypothetical protein